MSSTTFLNGTVVQPAWLNDVNAATYFTAANVMSPTYGAKGDGVTNDTAAINAAIAANSAVFLPPGNYLINTLVISGTRKTIFTVGGVKLTLANGTNNNAINVVGGSSYITISGLELVGNSTNNINSGGIGFTGGTGSTYVEISNNYIHNFANDGIRFSGTNMQYVNCYGNTLEANGTAGLTSDDTIQFFTWHGNIARFNGTHGIGLIGTGLDGVISANNSSNNGQGTPNADNFTGYNANCARLTITGNVSNGGLNNGIHFGGNFITYTDNVVTGATQYGLVHQSSGTTPAVSNGVVMSGNVVNGNNGPAGILVGYCNSGSITGNVSNGNINHGLLIDNSGSLSISGNTFRSNGQDGLRAVTAAANLAVTGNVSTNNGTSGMRFDTLSSSTVTGNVLRLNTTFGLVQGGSDIKNIFANNMIVDNTGGTISGSYDVNTVFASNITDATGTIASAATLTLPPYTDTFLVTGTTGIVNIGLSWYGREIKLIFSGVLTITEGNNLEMNGNFTTTATSSTITFVCRGTKWTELGRSAN